MATFNKSQVIDQGSLANFATWAECHKVYLLPNGHDVIAIRSERDEQAMRASPHCRGAQLVWARGQTIPFDWEGFAVETYRVYCQTEAEARAAAQKAGIGPDRIRKIETSGSVVSDAAEATGADAEQASSAAKRRVPDKAFEVSGAEIIQTEQTGNVEIQAETEAEARQQWKFLSNSSGLIKLTGEETQQQRKAGIPPGATLAKLECAAAPQKGFMGVGKKPGLWKAYWSTSCRARVAYKLPPEYAIVTYKA